MKRKVAAVLCVFCVCLLSGPKAYAQVQSAPKPTRKFTVATRVLPPFVISDNGKLTGFSVELWRAIAAESNIDYSWSVQPSVVDLLKSVKSRKADVGIAAISITADRYRSFDFSQPMFDSGLQIMVRDQETKKSFLPEIASIFPPALLRVIGLMLIIILLPANIVWIAERGHPDAKISKSYIPGIFESCWWALSTLATQADDMPKSGWGRFLAVVWMFVGVAFVAYFTATLTTAQTVQQLRGSIQGVDDLPGKQVATTTGSTSAQYLRNNGANVKEYPLIENAYDALNNDEVDAVVADSPVLLYYASHQGKGKVRVIGSVFREENFGIVFPANSSYRKTVDQSLLRLREDGTYETLYNKWFGSK